MNTAFPAVGHRYLVDFGAFQVELFFTSLGSLTYTDILSRGERGQSETVNIRITPIGDLLFLVTWQEADKTTVVHVEDFQNNTIITNITNPDLSFNQFKGTFTESVGSAFAQNVLTYSKDILPLFRDTDIKCMTRRGVPLSDSSWMCNPDHAKKVYAKLSSGEMPPDAPWPPQQIELFNQWIVEGCQT
ncbi:MoaF-related domain-containing protein [Caballeronia sordidicola]|uniref:MoaF-related domain-containing protein n=1 Tax=Caballeronia sordidicola TaxID=196367 RepID=UPI001C53388B|nr:hypothetical protein [Caballeronia sordidicola]